MLPSGNDAAFTLAQYFGKNLFRKKYTHADISRIKSYQFNYHPYYATQSTFWRKWTNMLTNCIWLLPILTLHMVLWTFRIILQPMIWPNWVQFAWKLTSSEQLYPQKCMNVLANRSMISILKSIKREKGRDYNAKLVKRNLERPWSTTTRKWVYLKKKVNLLKTNKNSRILKL